MRRRVAEDAHAFEREVEQDPFLYEAIEGFEDLHVSDIQQALDELDDRLDRKTRRRIVIPWKMVAGVAAIIGVGVALFSVLPMSGDGNMANESTPAEAETEATQGPDYKPRYVQPSFSVLEAPEVEAIATADSTETVPDEMEEAVALAEPVVIPAQEETQRSERVAPTNADSKNQYRQVAKESADASTDIADADDGGTTTNAESEVGISADFAMEETAAPSKAIEQLSVSSEKSTPQNARTASTATPSNGMKAYRQYLSDGVKKADDMPRGSVVVSFEFDKNGQPRKVKVERSLCSSCDKQAIKLIENGPNWIAPDRKQRMTIEVPFQ